MVLEKLRRLFQSPAPAAPPRSFLGKTAILEGNVEGTGAFVLAGQMTGDLVIHGPVTLEKGAHLTGPVQAESVITHGTIQGPITVTQLLRIGASGAATGLCRAARVAVAEGGVLHGEVAAGPLPSPPSGPGPGKD